MHNNDEKLKPAKMYFTLVQKPPTNTPQNARAKSLEFSLKILMGAFQSAPSDRQ